MLNAAEGKFMSLRLADHDLNVLAWDGLTLPAPDPVQDVLLTSGNRVEVLVKAGAPGTYDLILSPASSQHPDVPGMEHATPVATENAELVVRPILTVEVTGSGPEMSLPASLPAWDPPMLPIVPGGKSPIPCNAPMTTSSCRSESMACPSLPTTSPIK